jgi:anaerobic selenocysteine-containing dehydrogenase
VAHARLFDGEALSARSSALRQRAPRPVARINPDTAKTLNLGNAHNVKVELNGASISMPLLQDSDVALGIVVLPAQAGAKIAAHQLPAQVSVTADSAVETGRVTE